MYSRINDVQSICKIDIAYNLIDWAWDVMLQKKTFLFLKHIPRCFIGIGAIMWLSVFLHEHILIMKNSSE